jgi:hypothetical protein
LKLYLERNCNVKGQWDSSWSAWFDGLTIIQENSGETVRVGPFPDQTVFH